MRHYLILKPKLSILSFLLLLVFVFFSCHSSDKNKNSGEKDNVKVVSPQIKNSNYLEEQLLSDFIRQVKPCAINTDVLPKPFSGLQFNKVIAYYFDGDEERNPRIIDAKTKSFCPVVIKQKELSESQIKKLITFISESKTYGEGTAACFMPHLAFVFYQDAQDVFEMDICLDCNYLIASAEIPATKAKKMKVENGLEIELNGFSKPGKEKIRQLNQELGFEYGKKSKTTN